MKRPVMNPMFLDDGTAARPRGEPRWRKAARFLVRVGKLLLTDVFRRKERLRVEIGTPASRFMRGLLYRALFVPALLAVLVTVLVVTAFFEALEELDLPLDLDRIELTGEEQVRLIAPHSAGQDVVRALLDAHVAMPGPDLPAQIAAGAAALDAAVHAWDVAVATGRPRIAV